MSTSRSAVLATVERSPAAAGAHDRIGWVGLFTDTATIEDPVGSRPHVGRAEIERFYDTFIGPRDITFHRDIDIVVGQTMLRDLVLEVAMGPAVTMRIPAILRYDVMPAGLTEDDLRISRLQAYWELPAMAWQFARNGPAAVPASLQLTRALLANQGPAGAAGFMSGLAGAGGRGKRCVAQVVDDACAGNEMSVRRLLGPDAEMRAGARRLRPAELVEALTGARRRTTVVAGRHVAVSVTGPGGDAVLIADVGLRPTRIRRLRVFFDDGPEGDHAGGRARG
ncbi:ketosteroid isomerase family protein [Mycobacterium sp. AMU20-3851]|uniref:ketosteroid isomerase family protein n=1 Tax=Mycobacterium sp. AMU20-3851 TaxID=3122055 RepID=UPI003754AF40